MLPFAFLSPCMHINHGVKPVDHATGILARADQMHEAHRLVEPEQNTPVARSVGLRPEHEPSLVPLLDVVTAFPKICVPVSRQR